MGEDLKGNRHIFPDYIINECGDKMIPNKGNLLFLKSCIYTSNNFPVRILIDEGGEIITCTFVVYISDNYFFCIDTSSVGKNFQSMIKIPVETFEKLNFNNCNYRIYVKESLI